MQEVNAQYNVARPGTLPVRLAAYQRRKMLDRFMRVHGLPNPDTTILDVGVTSDRTYEASNYLEAWYPFKDRITASGIDDAAFLSETYPGMKFVQADALNLPFADRAFDVVHASAVIEHVGSFDNQVRMISECARVARKGLFITTPNRWFPVEFHTVLPLVHWLPKTVFRRTMRSIGRDFFADEANLNLMSGSELRQAAQTALIGERFNIAVESVKLGGWPANLLLICTPGK
jgi:hypothetical protein